jgi:hypothetical protein
MMAGRTRTSESKVRALARQLTVAAVEVTGDDPLRGTSIDSVAKHLGLNNWEEIDQGIAEAARLGWLRTSGGKTPHSVSVTATWRRERAPKSRALLTMRTRSGSRRGI